MFWLKPWKYTHKALNTQQEKVRVDGRSQTGSTGIVALLLLVSLSNITWLEPEIEIKWSNNSQTLQTMSKKYVETASLLQSLGKQPSEDWRKINFNY